MSTAAVTTPEPQIQTVPTPAGQPPVQPVQPRDDQGRFAAQPTPTPASNPTPTPTPAPAAQPAPQPFQREDLGNGRYRLTYETGEKFEGTTDELIAATANAHVNTKRWAQQQRQAQPQPVQQQPAPVAQTPKPVFADPTEEATAKYVADLQARYLGFADAETMKREMGFIAQTTEQSAGRDLSIQFMAANPDFNATPENSEKLTATLATLVGSEEAWGRLPQPQQLSLMRAAHAMNIQQKVYEATPPQQSPPATPSIPPPPIPTGKSPEDTFSGVPKELIPDINDNQQTILTKISKLKEMGFWR